MLTPLANRLLRRPSKSWDAPTHWFRRAVRPENASDRRRMMIHAGYF